MPSPASPPPDPRTRGDVSSSTPGSRLPPRVLADRYRLDSVIGKGSMGTVWAATDLVLHRQVAIKQIDFPPGTPAGERAQLEARTLREARAIAALSNPYVITLFDILTLEHGPVIVMELLRARSLAEILRRVGRLPDGQAATIGVAVASGLIAAHAAGITHRDVKPGNVLICDDGRIKLTDFGIARSSSESTMTATGLLLGSPAYIAPEVANGVPVGPISDAWSLGGLLFATVEGRPPFDQGTAIATLTSVVKDPVPPHPHSGRLGAVVSGLLVKTPSLRMRIDRALTIMRTIADDPSGMNLAAVARIPRDEDTAPALSPINERTGTGAPVRSSTPIVGRTGAAATGASAGTGRPGAGPPSAHHSGTNNTGTGNPADRDGQGPAYGHGQGPVGGAPPLRATARPAITGDADPAASSGTYAPTPNPAMPPTAGASPSAGPAARPPAAGSTRSTDTTNSPPWSSPPERVPPTASWTGTAQPITSEPSRRPSAPQRPASRPITPSSAGGEDNRQKSRWTPPPGGESAGRSSPLSARPQHNEPPLPPPPWAPEQAAALPPLPDEAGGDMADSGSGAGHSTRFRIVAAVLVAIIAAILGFAGVRIIADLASQSASQNGAQVVTTAAPTSVDIPGAAPPESG